jgi:putative transposase
MCRILGIPKSSYYAWLRDEETDAARRRATLKEQIKRIFFDSKRTYGYRRIHAQLLREGFDVDDELVRRLMRSSGLMPVQVRHRHGLTRPDSSAGPIPDLVKRDFTARAPGLKMVGDITQIDTLEGPLYLASVIDYFSKSVVGWAMDIHYPAALVCSAFMMAARRLSLPESAIFHSDRGSQYTSREFARTLKSHNVHQSVGRTGICFDNAMAESFFGKLKTEWLHHRKFASRAEARSAVIHYIEGFYNRQRLHSALNYRTPYETLGGWYTEHRAA